MGGKLCTTPPAKPTQLHSLSAVGQSPSPPEPLMCGLLHRAASRDTPKWEQNALKYCSQESSLSAILWRGEVLEVLRRKVMARQQFMKEFNEIRYLQKGPEQEGKHAKLTQNEVYDFKKNLKKSVLISVEQLTKVTENKPRQVLTEQQGNTAKQPQISLESVAYRKSLSPSINLNKSRLSHSFLRQSVINMVDDTMASILKGEQKQEISKNEAHALDLFVKFTIMLEKHLNNSEHKLNYIIRVFYDRMYAEYDKEGIRLQPGPQPLAGHVDQMQCEAILKNVKVFINFLSLCVEDYYGLKQTAQGSSLYLIASHENILTLTTTILFKNETFYNFIFNMMALFWAEKEHRIQEIFVRIHNRPPEQFSIRREYCLNNATIKKYIDEMSSIESNLENLAVEELSSTNQLPYRNCSQSLVRIAQSRTPVAKMKCIVECAELITDSIAEFYHDNQLNNKNKMLDADQVISIFGYVLSLNKINHIYSHLFFIEQFATEHQINYSKSGYYWTVLSAAVSNLLEEDDNPRKGDRNGGSYEGKSSYRLGSVVENRHIEGSYHQTTGKQGEGV